MHAEIALGQTGEWECVICYLQLLSYRGGRTDYIEACIFSIYVKWWEPYCIILLMRPQMHHFEGSTQRSVYTLVTGRTDSNLISLSIAERDTLDIVQSLPFIIVQDPFSICHVFFNNWATTAMLIYFKRGLLHWRSHEKGWVLWFQHVKDRFVLPTFQSEYSDRNVGKTNLSFRQDKPVFHMLEPENPTFLLIYFV